MSDEHDERPYLQAARRAGHWIVANAVDQEAGGVAWNSVPGGQPHISSGIYFGSAGIVSFLVELYKATHEGLFLECAIRGAQWLVARIGRVKQNGLYFGLSGIGFALHELWNESGDRWQLQATIDVVRHLKDRAREVDSGVEWEYISAKAGRQHAAVYKDVLYGIAGIGLFLLYVGQELDQVDALELADRAGRRLVDLADPRLGGLDWGTDPLGQTRAPNFAHGTAGVAYYLAKLAGSKGEELFLNAALKGAQYLQSIAVTEDGVCLIQQADPPDIYPGADNRPRYHLGWCHGPSGTAALWYQLSETTGDKDWLLWLERAARSLFVGELPRSVQGLASPADGSTYCHGLPGNGDFLLGASRVLNNEPYRRAGFALMDQCLARAVEEGDGLTWNQSYARWNDKNKRREESQIPLSGFSKGTAGIGLALLHADACSQGRRSGIHFLDLPISW